MKKNLVLTQHLTISLVVLAILFGIIFSSFSLVQDILMNPNKYFSPNLSATQIQFFIVYFLLITASVLISYIIYLLLTARTRTELQVLSATESIDLSKDQFVKLYEGAPGPYLILNEKGDIKSLNKAALRFFGAVATEVENKNIFSYVHKEDLEKSEKLLQYYKAKMAINREEIRVVPKDGDVRWIMLSIFEMGSFENAKHTGLATMFDITDQKNMDQAKTEFVSLASHQLRTPVAAVKWLGDMLLSPDLGELSPKQKDYISRIYKTNEEMISLVDTLLNVSRIEIGSLKIDSLPTNAIDLTESVLTELSTRIEDKKLVINKQYGNNLKDIKSDPKLLRIVIQNLLSNAVKYTPNGGTITVTFKDSLTGKSIVVSDNGIGIPKEAQSKIFTKLFRADNVRVQSSNDGTGLGLYLVKSMIEKMGGDIHFTSEEGKGSTFTIEL